VQTVERMPSADAKWQPARKGDTFVLGSAVRTGAASTAKLRVGKSGKLDVRPSSVVYFTRDGKAKRDSVKVETGSVEIEAGDDNVGLGAAVLEPHARVAVDATAAGTTIVVTLGKVVLEDNIIEAGKSITLSTTGSPVAAVPPKVPEPPKPRDGITVVVTGTAKAGDKELAAGEHSLEANTMLAVPADSTVTIDRGGASGQSAGPSQMKVTDGDALVSIVTGAVALRGDSNDAVAEIPGGKVTAKAGGSATAHVDKTGTQVTGQRGTTIVETASGNETVEAGESVTITPAGAIEKLPPPPKTTVATFEAGESPTIHDVRAPTAVRVKLGCDGRVEVAKDKAFKRIVARSGGTEAANVLVPAGSFFYRVRCSTGKGASGTIRVAKDAGSRPLPKTAAKTFVDLDGRDYTIYYQNLLPELTFALRNAPRSLKYTFVVKSASGSEKRFPSMTPKVTLPAGELREGTYTAWAELDAGRKSESGRIVIEFDNAAASVSIDGVEGEGTGLRVRGTVIEATTVSVNGVAVDLDRHRRFSADLPADDQNAPAVRIAHPKTGVHYYVVRDGGK